MTPTQRAAMQAALDALEDCRHGCEEPHKTASAVTALRAALAEPAVEPTISLPRDMDEELYYIVGSAMGAQSPDQCERADGLWRKLVARADRDKARQPPPAEVPLLTDDEIAAALPWVGFDDLIESYSARQLHAGLRAIEELVRQNAGLK